MYPDYDVVSTVWNGDRVTVTLSSQCVNRVTRKTVPLKAKCTLTINKKDVGSTKARTEAEQSAKNIAVRNLKYEFQSKY